MHDEPTARHGAGPGAIPTVGLKSRAALAAGQSLEPANATSISRKR